MPLVPHAERLVANYKRQKAKKARRLARELALKQLDPKAEE
jgi:hypothetical protein